MIVLTIPPFAVAKKGYRFVYICCPREAKFTLSKSLTKPVLGDNAENTSYLRVGTKISDTVSITIC
jgi:hypothetical protein